MSQPATDATAFYAAGREGRLQDIPARLHSDFEFHPMAGFPHGRPYRGWAAVATEFFQHSPVNSRHGPRSPRPLLPLTVNALWSSGIKGTTEIAKIPFVDV